MNIFAAILLIAALLAVNAFFVGTEFSLVSSRKDRLESLLAQGKTGAKDVLYAIEHLSIYLAGAQFGITVASLVLGKVAEPAVASYIEGPFLALGMPANLLHPVAFILALAIISFLHILFGEMVPKNIAIAGPEQTAFGQIVVAQDPTKAGFYLCEVASPAPEDARESDSILDL